MSVRPPLVVAALAGLAIAGCGGSHQASRADTRTTFETYFAQVERVRLPVNRLLEGADPILSAYRRGRIGAAEAERRMGALERRFAGYERQIAAVRPVPAAMRATQSAYAHTYVLEDSYLRALTAALPARDYSHLPHTANAQRSTVAVWRRQLESVARKLGVSLPADIRIAGRGEIAPSPVGD